MRSGWTPHGGRLTVDGPASWTRGGTMFLKGAAVPLVRGSRLRLGELDLHDNALIIDYDPGPTSPLANFSAYLTRGYNDGARDGKVMDFSACVAKLPAVHQGA